MPTLLPFDREDLTRRLAGLSGRCLVVFALSCAERLFPFYEAFSIEEQQGHPSKLRAAIDFGWSFAEGVISPENAYEAACSSLDEAALAEYVWQSVYAGGAGDAVAAVHFVLKLIRNPSPRDAASASLLLQNILDGYLAMAIMPMYLRMSLEENQAIGQYKYHTLPLFVAELEKQEFDINILVNEGCSTESIAKVRRVGAIGVQPVERFSIRARAPKH
jgi:hypothetical protein